MVDGRRAPGSFLERALLPADLGETEAGDPRTQPCRGHWIQFLRRESGDPRRLLAEATGWRAVGKSEVANVPCQQWL